MTEREAFDACHYEQYLLENPNIDISNAKYIYDYAHKNVLVCQLRESHFTAWQAAKAQAVPDGFVVVHIDALARAAQNIRELNNGEYYSEEIEENVCNIEAIIEAQDE